MATIQPSEGQLGDASAGSGAGAAGFGGGTLLALLANNLPQDHPSRSWLILLAPSATLAISWLWARLTSVVLAGLQHLRFRRDIRQLRRTLTAAIADEHHSDEYRGALRQQLQELTTLDIESQFNLLRRRR